jgi:hypothetical protein
MLVLLIGLWCSGCSESADRVMHSPGGMETDDQDVEQIAREYRSLTLLTSEPAWVDPQLAVMCVASSPEEIERSVERYGPHAYARVNIYMNGRAAAAFRQGREGYPVGSVVVKQKLTLGPRGGDASALPQADGVGGMVKRPAGYDPEHGDWEYFYFEDPTKIDAGRIASCVQCHAGAANRDYVFGDWARQ